MHVSLNTGKDGLQEFFSKNGNLLDIQISYGTRKQAEEKLRIC